MHEMYSKIEETHIVNAAKVHNPLYTSTDITTKQQKTVSKINNETEHHFEITDDKFYSILIFEVVSNRQLNFPMIPNRDELQNV